MNVTVLTCTLVLPVHFRATDILSFHGRDAQAIAEEVDVGTLRKGIVWQGSPACLTIRFQPRIADVELAIDGPLTTADADALSGLATRMLGLSQPIADFERRFRQHPQLGGLIAKQPGLRVPVAASVFEALSWAITGQQISVAAAVSIRRKLIQMAGLHHSGGLHCYPDAHRLADLSVGDFRLAGFSQSKAQSLLTLSKMIVAGELVLEIGNHEQMVDLIRQQLLQIRGIGPWTVNYALLRGYGWLDGSLHGDVAVRRGLQILLNSADPVDELQTRIWLESFAPWRALVAAHLWALVPGGG